jgi:hypothetical protein
MVDQSLVKYEKTYKIYFKMFFQNIFLEHLIKNI